MIRVILESPFKASSTGTEAEHRAYLQRCIRDCLARGESPYASHQMLTNALDDADEKQRELGIAAGLEWRKGSAVTVVYDDYGISQGMKLGIAHASRMHCHTIEFKGALKNVIS